VSSVPFVTFEIYGTGAGATINLIQGPENLTDKAQPAPLPAPIPRLSEWPSPKQVQSFGEALVNCLNNVKEEAKVREALRYAANIDGTIYFKLKSTEWESHAWEALWDESDFFLLKPRRGIARVVEPWGSRSSLSFALEQPVRIMAVLSAAGLTNGPQCDALLRAAEGNAGTANGIPLHIHVLTGEEGLADRLRAAPGRNDNRLVVTVENIDSGHSRMVSDAIRRFRPHILHFFCHGQVANGVGMLHISDIEQHRASLSNLPPDGTQNSFILDFGAFREIIDLARAQGWLWLAVLNACKLGATAANVMALAQKLVLGGVPAAVGMTEEIDADDASAFCEAFYSSLFLGLETASAALASGQEHEVDCAKLLHGPRMSISSLRKPATCNPQWTFPVVYIGVDNFKLKKPPQSSGTTIDELANLIRAGALQQLGGAPAGVRETIARVEV
jgi:hypothetical protein